MSHAIETSFYWSIVRRVAAVLILLVALGGCSFRKNRILKTENVLYEAGFQKVPADTPEKLAHLKTLPQHKMLIHHHKDGDRYVYADASLCQCMYVGNKDDYQSYKHILLEKVVKDHENVQGLPENAGVNWDLWGDFTPDWTEMHW